MFPAMQNAIAFQRGTFKMLDTIRPPLSSISGIMLTIKHIHTGAILWSRRKFTKASLIAVISFYSLTRNPFVFYATISFKAAKSAFISSSVPIEIRR